MNPKPYPYQTAGAAYLAARRCAYLADAPGVGKTAQAILAHAQADPFGPLVIVCPASAVPVWRAEVHKWDHPPADAVASYAKMPRLEDLPRHATLVLDEAHYLKNPASARTRHAAALCRKAGRIWALSGTPVPNHPGELYPLGALMGVYGHAPPSYESFIARYCHTSPPVRWGAPPQIRGAKPGAMQELARLWRPYLLRRTKAEVLPDLPPLRIDVLPVSGPAFPAALAASPEYAELARLASLADEHGADLAALVAATTLNLAELRRTIGVLKAAPVARYVVDALESGQPALVVMAWHKDVLNVLQDALARAGVPVSRLDGSSSAATRKAAVDDFQNGKTRVFLGNIQAAGTAITLTRADRLIFAESSWTPADMEQAMNRIHRIGSVGDSCLVQVATLSGTVDDVVERTIARKMRGINEFLGA